MYPADGRKIPDCYTQPPELREELNDLLGRFPLYHFWGPMASIASSEWIANCAIHVLTTRKPTLTLIYIPHLDYNLQRLDPEHHRVTKDMEDVDAICGLLITYAQKQGMEIIVISEYAVTPVSRPIHINRALRKAGYLVLRDELGRELLDPATSPAFAVADHQIAHIYVNQPDLISDVKLLIERLPGVEQVLDGEMKRSFSLDHPRSGELIALAQADSWFTYYYWLDDARCPDFARTVDIHRKPGYDPVELFLDPGAKLKKVRVGWKVLKSALGFRTLFDLVPLDPLLVRGSHGRVTDDATNCPVFVSSNPDLLPNSDVEATAVKDLILAHIFP